LAVDVERAIAEGLHPDRLMAMIARVRSFSDQANLVNRLCQEHSLPKVQTRGRVNEIRKHLARSRAASAPRPSNPFVLDLDGLRWTITEEGVFPLTDKSGVWEVNTA